MPRGCFSTSGSPVQDPPPDQQATKLPLTTHPVSDGPDSLTNSYCMARNGDVLCTLTGGPTASTHCRHHRTLLQCKDLVVINHRALIEQPASATTRIPLTGATEDTYNVSCNHTSGHQHTSPHTSPHSSPLHATESTLCTQAGST
jgi:hypothetical protein